MKNIVEKLKTEEKVFFTAHGNSMLPKIKDGEEVIVFKIIKDPVVGDCFVQV
jgi:phage repressor protein C with HTH and peptisase S24 domain